MKKKRKKLKFFIFIIIIIFILAGGAFSYFKISTGSNISFLSTINYSISGNITYYDIYGTHLNIKGNIQVDDTTDLQLVLTNGYNEVIIPWEIEESDNYYEFTTSNYINEGIDLEELNKGNYYLLIKGIKNEENIYYSVTNDTEYEDLVYYTLTKNGKNNKIEMTWSSFNSNSIWKFVIKQTTLPDDVYDITIDPGHDASDSGTLVCSDGSPVTSAETCTSGTLYKESDINLMTALALKEELENLGYKVKITRSNEDDDITTYGDMGSATTANQTKSKFNLAIHHNSSGVSGGLSSLKGLEIYVANNISFELAELFVENITSYANTQVSTKQVDWVQNGIYQRFFTEDEIRTSNNANITTNTIYYYAIREVGGIATNAYAEDNAYKDSNNTAESYLFELGYLDNVSDLNNILNNKEGYAKGIAYALEEYLS